MQVIMATIYVYKEHRVAKIQTIYLSHHFLKVCLNPVLLCQQRYLPLV